MSRCWSRRTTDDVGGTCGSSCTPRTIGNIHLKPFLCITVISQIFQSYGNVAVSIGKTDVWVVQQFHSLLQTKLVQLIRSRPEIYLFLWHFFQNIFLSNICRCMVYCQYDMKVLISQFFSSVSWVNTEEKYSATQEALSLSSFTIMILLWAGNL